MLQNTLKLELLREYQPILVAVSGGADSMALAAYLHENDVEIVVASFDHQIRNDSAADIAFVATFCNQKGIQFISGKANVPKHATENKRSLEESARDLRYQFLFKAASSHQCKAIAVGHTMDDQAETVLMRFIRGAGIAGLKGMLPMTTLEKYSPDIVILRPILEWRRADTEAYCEAQAIHPRYDSTNQDPTYPRNKIRAELIPILREYNPSITETLARNAGVLAQQHAIYSDLVETSYTNAILGEGKGWIAFSNEIMAEMPPVMRHEIIRKAVFSLRPGIRDVGAEIFERFSESHSTDLGGGIRTIFEGDVLFITEDPANLPDNARPQIFEPIELHHGDNILNNGWTLNLQINQTPVTEAETKNSSEVWIDISEPAPRISLRKPRAGDRFIPFGFLTGSVKISDLFINNKLPARFRKNYPILLVEDEIVWIPLFRRSNTRSINKNTRLAARITIKKKS